MNAQLLFVIGLAVEGLLRLFGESEPGGASGGLIWADPPLSASSSPTQLRPC